ncbi:uncharacterized protein EV422DRAFT_517577 [Fimicolochytrium jonesii]|uniref:uncharacterized protein n=1 Tax=Fimicolochytrium jonesii TaxID=1396493 RepID=UPI0022FF1AAE|nr:uncharacterized protein EV422DRAFT_517577 [Fimicolochytrium jonesii]KAI8825134.1 hypothetical protein EV422DRAFT_517577 [Fimicolochytrium jonesii]
MSQSSRSSTDLLPPNPILDQFYKNRDIRVPSQVQYQIVGAALRHCNDPRAYPLSQMEEDIAALTTDLTTVGDIGFLVGRHAWFDAGPAVARALMDKPARSGDEFAAYNLARIMSTDHPHSNRNLQAAMKIFRELADKNHAGAQFKVGERMVKAHDIPGGMKMLEKSAANGHAEAAVYLGVFYKDGFKNWVSVDRVKAMKYLRQAHDAGNPEASYHISVMYSFGQHDPSGQPDHWKSFAFLTIAANAGIPRAQHNLGICYMVPPALEIPYDPFLGVQYLSMAADQNLMPSLINLARLYLYGNLKGKVYPDYGVAENYLKRAFAITQNDRDKYFIYGPEVEGLMEDMRRLIKGEVLSMDPVVLGAKKAVDE